MTACVAAAAAAAGASAIFQVASTADPEAPALKPRGASGRTCEATNAAAVLSCPAARGDSGCVYSQRLTSRKIALTESAVSQRAVRMCYLPDGGGSAGPGPCAGDAWGGGCWLAVLDLSHGSSSVLIQSNSGVKRSLTSSSSMIAAATAERRDAHVPIYAWQTRALCLCLLCCLLLTWPRRSTRLRRWPPVVVSWIHLGFTALPRL